ncbi:MAG: VWA domain-containing protein [Lachnospiraceae bacterium]|nr:VWA domain-containing protein [Lachnospiraceae bacterium]
MTVQNIWPLAFLVLVPIVILLYILKQKAKDQPFSSILLWQEVYKNLEARTPFERFRHNLLMYLQIGLLLLLIAALMAPVLRNGGKGAEQAIVVLDNSASMQYEYEAGISRLEYAKKEALRVVDRLSEDSNVTVVSCGAEASVVYQGTDKSTLKRRIRAIEATNETGTLDVAASLMNSLLSGMEQAEVFVYTDTEFALDDWKKAGEKAAFNVESVYSKGKNCSVDYVNYSVEDTGITALCKVSNYTEDAVTQDVSLYANDQLLQVQSVTIPADDSTTVYFDTQDIPADGSVILKAALSDKDSLVADNEQSIGVVDHTDRSVLLVSEGNVFLEKALALEDSVTVYKTDSISALTQETYDLYVFDGMDIPEDMDWSVIPKEASVLFFHTQAMESFLNDIKPEEEQTNVLLTFVKSPVTNYVEDTSFAITQTQTYELPEWGIPVIETADGAIAGYYGTCEERMTGVFGFDIHNTDVALKTEFPIFMSQLAEALLHVDNTKAEEIENYPVERESDVTAAESAVVEGAGASIRTGGRMLRNGLLIVVLLLLIVEWIVYTKQVHSSKKRQYLVVRCILLLIVILAIAGIAVPKKQKKAETIFLVDVSDSMAGNRDQMEEYLAKMLDSMPAHNLAGVVTFGKDTAVEQFLTEQKKFQAFAGQPVTTATNIEKAVKAACTMFDEGASKQLVLLTDGSENDGNMTLSASILKANDVDLSVIPMTDSIGQSDEVYIDGLTTPKVIHVGDHYNITVSVMSNVETDALLFLYAGRVAKGQQEIHVTKGENQFVFEDVGEEGSIAQYKAVIEPEQDTISVNNTYVTFAQVETRPKVLLVEGTNGEASEFEKVLQAANIDYDLVTPGGVPTSLSQLNVYKAVITLNVHYDDLRKGFAKILPSYVKDYAGGYICIGGDNSYALGNYKGTELEEVLPVNMELQGEKEIPKMAMALVIDQSGSMCAPSVENGTVTGLDLAKQAAIAGISELRETDEAGVLAFDDSYNWTVPIGSANDLDAIEDEIRSIGYGGGTSIYPALEQAYKEIAKSDAKIKHIILLTDGQDDYQRYDGLLDKITQDNITVSTVAVGEDAAQDILSHIAEKCGGRYYYTDVNNSIPRIFAQEVYLSTKTYLVNQEFYPVVTSNNEILSGVMEEGCPPLYGYIAATSKAAADVILQSEEGDPILTTWQYGLGRTIAWNSDGTNEWTGQFAAWDAYPLLWSNMIQYVIADTELGGDSFEVTQEGNQAVISYETSEYDTNTKVEAVVTDENGESKEVTLEAVKPGSYAYTLDAGEIGVYSINIRKKDGDTVTKAYNTAYANQYAREYQFNDGGAELATFVKQAGGREITMEDSVWKTQQEKMKTKVSLTIPLLIFAMFLLLFDIMIRRWSVDIYGLLCKKCIRVLDLGQKAGQRIHVNIGRHKEKTKRNRIPKDKISAGKQSGKKDNKPKEPKRESLDMNQLLQKKKERER